MQTETELEEQPKAYVLKLIEVEFKVGINMDQFLSKFNIHLCLHIVVGKMKWIQNIQFPDHQKFYGRAFKVSLAFAHLSSIRGRFYNSKVLESLVLLELCKVVKHKVKW